MKIEMTIKGKKFDLDLRGFGSLGNLDLDMKLVKVGRNLIATTTIPSITTSSLISALGASFIPGGDGVASVLEDGGFNSFSVEDAIITVTKQPNATSLTVDAKAVIPVLPETRMNLVALDLNTKQRKVALALDVAKSRLSDIVDSLSGVDIRDVPYLGDLEIPAVGIVIANNNIKLPSGYAFRSPLLNAFPVTKGASLNFQRSIANKITTMKMKLKPSDFDIELSNSLTLQEAIGALIPPMKDTPMYNLLPTVVPGVFTTSVTRLMYNKTAGRFLVEGKVGSATLIPNLLSIENAVFSGEVITAQQKGGTSKGTTSSSKQRYRLAVDGIAVLAGLRLAIKIAYDQVVGSFYLRITSPTDRIELSKMFQAIGPLGTDNPVVNALGLDRVVIDKPLFEVSQKSSTTSFRVSGSPNIPRFGSYGMELIASTRPRQLIVTFSKSDASLTGFLNALTGIDLSGVPFLTMFSGPSAIGVTISPQDFKVLPKPFTTYPLNEITQVQSGLGAIVKFGLPAEAVCSQDMFCNFFHTILGDRKITFRITGVTGPKMTFSYRLPGEIGIAGWKLYKVDLGVKLGSGAPAVGLTNIEMDIPVNDGQKLHFTGALTIDAASNADAKLQIDGIWQKAFGIPFLAVGNALGRLKINIPCPICPVAFAIGGEIAIGTNCFSGNSANCIMSQGYLSMAADDPDENFLYYRLNQFSYRDLLKAMGLPDIPGLQSVDHVTAKDVVFSVSRKDRVLPSGFGTVSIPAGVYMKGKINLFNAANLDFNLAVDVLFGAVVKSINASITLSPINLGPGGLVRFTSTKNPALGPSTVLQATLLPLPKFYFRLDGKLSIPSLRAEASAFAVIDDNGIHVNTVASLLSFRAEFDMRAAFESVSRPQSFKGFRLVGKFTTLAESIMKGVHDNLNKAKQRLNSALNSAVSAARAAEKKLNDAIDELNVLKNTKAARERAFNSASRDLQSARHHVNNVCHYKNCNRHKSVPKPCTKTKCTCVPKPWPCCSGWSCRTCCGTVCIPYISTCGTHQVPYVDPICTADNGRCAIQKETAKAALFLAEQTIKGTQTALNEATKAVNAATKKVGDLRPLSNAANAASAAARAAFDGITSIVNGFFNSFQVHGARFDVDLSSITNGHVCVNFDITVTGTRHRFKLCVNLNNLVNAITAFGKRMFSRFL